MENSAGYERIFNFRDFGGYRADGGRVVTGKLFRSGHHYDASTNDLALFAGYDISTIIDLRGDSERSTYPCRRAAGFSADVLFAAGETDGRDPAVPPANFEDAAAFDRRMIAVYGLLPFLPALTGTYTLFLDALIERSGASMVHCFAGKDRTGIAVALVHLLIGVHRDDVMADYLRSGDPALIERRMAVEGPAIRAKHGAVSDAALRRMFGVEAHYLEAALQAMAARHGSIAGYAQAVLGVTPQRLTALHARLLV